MLRYYRLWDLLARRHMKKTDLLAVISAPTLAKLTKGENINTSVIDKICEFLKCQPEDIMEYFIDVNDNNDVRNIETDNEIIAFKNVSVHQLVPDDYPLEEQAGIRMDILDYTWKDDLRK